jgi:hypothetical protein
MCSVLEVSSSGYYQWLKSQPSARASANAELDKSIIQIFTKHKGRYGAMRITAEYRKFPKGALVHSDRGKSILLDGISRVAERKQANL